MPITPPSSGDLDRFADDLQKLRVEYERFFNGATAVPPEAQRDELEARMRQLRNAPARGAAEQFRLSSLEARFNSYQELWRRRLSNLEEGRTVLGRRPAPATAAPIDVERGVVVRHRVGEDAAEALYRRLQEGSGALRVDLDRFRGYLESQLDTIRQRTGAAAVRFRLAEEGGKMKLKAMPVEDGGSTP
jgi:hypothetical protein